MNANSTDVFARAMLYIYQARLGSLGIKGDLKPVRAAEPNEPKMEEV